MLDVRDLIEFDHELLLKINSWHSTFFDNWMWYYSQKWTWIGLYVLLIVYLIYRYRHNSVWILIAIAATIGLADWGSHELKHLFMRPRPTHNATLSELIYIVNDYRGGAYGFPSSHACNSFALTTIISLVSRDKILTTTLILWSTINAYSRMYLGVHYPADIATGTILGILIGVVAYLPLHYTKKNKPSAYINESTNKYCTYSIPAMWISTMTIICFL